ncbi:MAG: methylmalonyl-CoA epimerase [Chloroflexi bacterium]|nr:methylmalonyl-CoA epimerase [Chloroflexota bacterium]
MQGKLDHVAIAVRSLDEAARVYAQLGLGALRTCTMDEMGVRVGFLAAGASQIELLEPLRPDSVVGKFLARRGEGLHHICLEVDDIEASLAELAAQGVELIDRTPRQGAEGRVAFIHPRATHGVLIELVQKH